VVKFGGLGGGFAPRQFRRSALLLSVATTERNKKQQPVNKYNKEKNNDPNN